jgi:hypothetical protein
VSVNSLNSLKEFIMNVDASRVPILITTCIENDSDVKTILDYI